MAPTFDSTPFWWQDAPLSEPPDNAPQQTCDVAIIGAGYTGLAAAIVLARAGRSVQLFDAMKPGEGASTRNGGIASGNLRPSLSSAMQNYGAEKALAFYREAKEAREDLKTFILSEKIDCDLQENGRFTGIISPAQMEAQEREVDLLNRHFGIGAYIVPEQQIAQEVATDSYRGGIVRPDIAMLHPAKLHAAMLKKAIEAGAAVFGNRPVTRHRREASGFLIEASKDKVFARHVIIATNGYGNASYAWLQRRIVPVKSRIVVTGELPIDLMRRLLPKGRAMGENRRLYRYYRPTPDGRRILLGARETLFSQDEKTNAMHVWRRLLQLFPELEPYGIAASWHGNVAFSRSELPLLFEHEGAIHACAYCGSGVVWARWLGTKAAFKILNSPLARSAFDCQPPEPVPLFRGYPWFLPAVMALDGLRDRIAVARGRRH